MDTDNFIVCAIPNIGSGGLVLYEEIEGRGFVETRRYPWQDGLFDVTWSEVSEGVLVAGGGDGNVLVFDQTIVQGSPFVLQGHSAEVSSVHWSVTRQEQLVLSASWDGTIRLWDPQAQSCLSVFPDHSGMVYTASWSPHLPHTFASVSGTHSHFVKYRVGECCTEEVWLYTNYICNKGQSHCIDFEK